MNQVSSSPNVYQEKKGFWSSLKRMRPYNNLHGSARFATFKEVEKMGYLKNAGVYIGGIKDKDEILYLRHNGPEHILAYAPTRSGKGVGLVIPTLLSWSESTVILDIKGENWALTSGWRKVHANNVCLRFDPAAPTGSVKFNPLAEIRLGTMYEVADAQNIATMIVDPDGKGLNDHWAKTGYSLIVGTVLHCLYVEREKGRVATIRDVADCLSDPESPVMGTLQTMLTTEHKDGAPHPVVASCARQMLNKSENELSGVVSTATSFLSLYQDPIVAANTAVSEFKIADLMNHDKPVSLYIVVPPSDKDRLKPLIRLLINQIVRLLTQKMEFRNGQSVKHYKHRLLLLLDEFPALGRLDIFQESLAFIAGYGLKAYLITQDLSQLYAAYGKEESIVSNCHIRIAFAPNKTETAEMMSKMLGPTTVNKLSVTASRKPGLFQSTQYSETWQEVQRPLLTTDECMKLPGPVKDGQERILEPGDMLIMTAGFSTIYGKQILYFKDPVFTARSQLPPPATDIIYAVTDAASSQASAISEPLVEDLPSGAESGPGSSGVTGEADTPIPAPSSQLTEQTSSSTAGDSHGKDADSEEAPADGGEVDSLSDFIP